MKKDLFKHIVREAHKITRALKEEFPTIDYRTQYGISFKYLTKYYKDLENPTPVKKNNNKNSKNIKVEIKIDSEIKIFNSTKECWEWLVNQKSIKSDIAKWFKNGVPKKYQDRIEYIKRIEKESTNENTQLTGQALMVIEEQNNIEIKLIDVKSMSIGNSYYFNNNIQLLICENGTIRLKRKEMWEQLSLRELKELKLPLKLIDSKDKILIGYTDDYISKLVGKEFNGTKVVGSFIENNKKYIKYLINGINRVLGETRFREIYCRNN